MTTPERYTINRPIRHPGTAEEKAANYRTHNWHTEVGCDPEDAEVRCWECDCKPWHVAASYPCGQEPPRETVEVGA